MVLAGVCGIGGVGLRGGSFCWDGSWGSVRAGDGVLAIGGLASIGAVGTGEERS